MPNSDRSGANDYRGLRRLRVSPAGAAPYRHSCTARGAVAVGGHRLAEAPLLLMPVAAVGRHRLTAAAPEAPATAAMRRRVVPRRPCLASAKTAHADLSMKPSGAPYGRYSGDRLHGCSKFAEDLQGQQIQLRPRRKLQGNAKHRGRPDNCADSSVASKTMSIHRRGGGRVAIVGAGGGRAGSAGATRAAPRWWSTTWPAAGSGHHDGRRKRWCARCRSAGGTGWSTPPGDDEAGVAA